MESGDRTAVFEVYQPDDLANAVGVLQVRSPGLELLELRRQVVEAKDDVPRAEEARMLAE